MDAKVRIYAKFRFVMPLLLLVGLEGSGCEGADLCNVSLRCCRWVFGWASKGLDAKCESMQSSASKSWLGAPSASHKRFVPNFRFVNLLMLGFVSSWVLCELPKKIMYGFLQKPCPTPQIKSGGFRRQVVSAIKWLPPPPQTPLLINIGKLIK